MEVIHERVAGIDISKLDLKMCIRADGLLAMRDWLLAEGVTVAGMEATGAHCANHTNDIAQSGPPEEPAARPVAPSLHIWPPNGHRDLTQKAKQRCRSP